MQHVVVEMGPAHVVVAEEHEVNLEGVVLELVDHGVAELVNDIEVDGCDVFDVVEMADMLELVKVDVDNGILCVTRGQNGNQRSHGCSGRRGCFEIWQAQITQKRN